MISGTAVSSAVTPKRVAMRPVRKTCETTVIACTSQSMRANARVCAALSENVTSTIRSCSK